MKTKTQLRRDEEMKAKTITMSVLTIFMLLVTIYGATAQKAIEEKQLDFSVTDLTRASITYNTKIETSKTTTDLQKAVTMTKTSINVDTITYPELNSPATITFYNTGLKNPKVLYNGMLDTSIIPKRLVGTTYSIDVTHFSNWTLVDTTWGGTFYNTTLYGTNLGLASPALMMLFANGSALVDKSISPASITNYKVNITNNMYFDGLGDGKVSNYTSGYLNGTQTVTPTYTDYDNYNDVVRNITHWTHNNPILQLQMTFKNINENANR